jgi:hypothetical protein
LPFALLKKSPPTKDNEPFNKKRCRAALFLKSKGENATKTTNRIINTIYYAKTKGVRETT